MSTIVSKKELLQKESNIHMNKKAYDWKYIIEVAKKLGDQVNTGTLFMNRCDYLDPGLSWTGVKETGKGCSLSEIAYEHLTKPKSFHLRKELK